MFKNKAEKAKALSRKQRQAVEFIGRFVTKKGYPPTIRDIVAGCNLSSTSVASYNLKILEKLGYIRRQREVSRGIELLSRFPAPGRVPLIGQIAAGQPIPVPEAATWETAADVETIEVGEDITRGQADIYALKVKGTSMIDALINDGDIVLLQPADAVDNGQMAAVWLKDEKEATLKKFYSEPGHVRLQPANRQMNPLYTKSENVTIQGRVVAIIRQLA
jgi:repressor LexA